MRRLNPALPPTRFKVTLLAASIVISLSSCTEMTDLAELGAAIPLAESGQYALPGLNFSRFEQKEDGLQFVSDSTPGFTALADSQSDIVIVDWEDSVDAMQYQVYRRESDAQLLNDELCDDGVFQNTSTFTEVAIINESTFIDTDVRQEIRYEYLVLAVNSQQYTKTVASGLIVSIGEAKSIIATLIPSTDPSNPDLPDAPVAPPAAANPDTTDAPVTPDVPVAPDAPVTPDAPTAPDEPVTPDAPELAEVTDPVEQEVVSPFEPLPVQPEAPVEPDVEAPQAPETDVDSPDVTPPVTAEPEVTDPVLIEPETPEEPSDTAEPVDSAQPETGLPVVGCSPGGLATSDPDAVVAPPGITLPIAGDTLSGSSVEFNWDNNSTPAIQWNLRFGSGKSTNNYYDSGRITDVSARSHMVTGLPTDGSIVHGQLAYKKPSGSWVYKQYEYKASTKVNTPKPSVVTSSPTAGKGNNNWDNKIQPPKLVNPIEIVLSANSPTTAITDFDRVGCEGLIHQYRLPYDEDVLVTMAPGSAALKYPVFIFGGRNLIMRGVEMRTVVQAGCDVGEAHQMRDTANLNIHPRLPGGKVFRLEQSGTTFIEGVDIDLKGQEADCFVMRNPSSMTVAKALTDRHFTIVNTRCTGIEGLDESPIGDGIHGDFWQNQGKDNLASFQVENISFRTSSNGITLHGWNGKKPKLFSLRNMDYGWDLRYDDDDAHELSGLAYSGHGEVIKFENVYLNHPRNGNYGFINGERIGAISRNNGYIKKVDGIYEGTPPGGDFATEDETGIEYISPY